MVLLRLLFFICEVEGDEGSLLACAGLDGKAPQAIAGFFDRHNRTSGQDILAFSEHLQESRCDGARCLIIESEKNPAR